MKTRDATPNERHLNYQKLESKKLHVKRATSTPSVLHLDET
jgi:hypothetical protein